MVNSKIGYPNKKYGDLWTAQEANEVKSVVNSHADVLDSHETSIGNLNSSLNTTQQNITELRTDAVPAVVSQTAADVVIKPNVLNVWGAVPSLTIGFAAGPAGRVNEYMIQFSCPADSGTILHLPSSVRWVDSAPEPEAGYTYQISIVNNLAVYAEWEAAGT